MKGGSMNKRLSKSVAALLLLGCALLVSVAARRPAVWIRASATDSWS
jgi:hypothetical protein